MQKSFKHLSALALALVAASAFAHGGSGSVSPTAASISTTAASGYVTGTGVSIQGAFNQGSATVNGAALGTGVGLGPLKAATSDVSGSVATTNSSLAGGLTVGSGSTGTHDAAGKSTASISGSAEGHTVTNGPAAIANGNVEGLTATQVSGTNTGLGAVSAGLQGSFNASAAASQLQVGPFSSIQTTSSAIGGVAGVVNTNFHLGTTSTQVDNQGAFNSFGQSKAGIQTSTSN